MIEMPLLSVVIIYYNSEKYVRQSVESVLTQNFNDYELLLVNDGSTDQTRLICEEYARSNKEIRVINKENGGISDARNTGIRHAEGEYILFIDGDDYIAPGGLQSFADKIGESDHRADYIWGRMKCFYDETGKVYAEQDHLSSDFINGLNGREAFIAMYERDGHISMGARGAFRRQFLLENKIYFPNRYYEDINVIMQTILKADYLMINPYPYYFFRDRKDSTSKKYSLRYPKEIFEEMVWWNKNSTAYHSDLRFMKYMKKEMDKRSKRAIIKYAKLLPLSEIKGLASLIGQYAGEILLLNNVVWKAAITPLGLVAVRFIGKTRDAFKKSRKSKN